MKKYFVLFIISIIFGCSDQPADEKEEIQENLPLVTWVHPEKTIQKKYYPALGLINTTGSGNLNWKSSGKIENIFVEEGQEIKEGTEMASLECKMQILDMANSETTLKQAKLALDDAENNLERVEKISHTGSITQEQLEKLQNAVDQARLNFESAEIMVTLKRIQVEDCSVLAPFDLQVEFLFSRIGNDVTIGMPAIKILPLKGMRMEILLAPHIAKQISLGNMLIDENENEWKMVHKTRSSEPGTGAINTIWKIETEMDSENGIWVTTTIDMGEIKGHIVPLSSIVQLKGPGVYRIDENDEIQWVAVEILVENDNTALIKGVEENERIVLRRPGNLRDGQKIRIAQ